MLTTSGHNYRTSKNNFSASFYNNHGGNEDITRQLVTRSPACFIFITESSEQKKPKIVREGDTRRGSSK